MIEQPLVSITVLNYNSANNLEATLESVNRQTYKHIELIIVDDGSTDNSVALIEKWLKNYPGKFKFIRHDVNKGMCAAYNSGLHHATGKYYAAIMAGDVMAPGKTTIQAAILERSKPSVAAVYSDAFIINEDGTQASESYIQRQRPFTEYPSGAIYEPLLEGNFIPGTTLLLKLSIFQKIGYFDETIACEEYDMWLRIAKKYKILYSDFPSVSCRSRVANEMATTGSTGYADIKIYMKHVDGPIPIGRLKQIVRTAYANKEQKTMDLVRVYSSKCPDKFFRAAWLLWKYKVHYDTADVVMKQIEGYYSVSVANWYINLSIYKDILHAIKTSNSSYFSSRK